MGGQTPSATASARRGLKARRLQESGAFVRRYPAAGRFVRDCDHSSGRSSRMPPHAHSLPGLSLSQIAQDLVGLAQGKAIRTAAHVIVPDIMIASETLSTRRIATYLRKRNLAISHATIARTIARHRQSFDRDRAAWMTLADIASCLERVALLRSTPIAALLADCGCLAESIRQMRDMNAIPPAAADSFAAAEAFVNDNSSHEAVRRIWAEVSSRPFLVLRTTRSAQDPR